MDLSMRNGQVSVKLEPVDPVEQVISFGLPIKEEIHAGDCKVWLKEEPKSDDEEQNISLETDYLITGNQNADISVKIEPFSSGSDSEDSKPLKPNSSSKRSRLRNEEDDEYIPEKTSKKIQKTVKNDNVKRIFKNKPRKQSTVIYSEEIMQNIEVITITEEQRQAEHRDLVNARKHMPHVCELCALGYVVRDAYLMHMKIHSPESGEHECDICHARIKTAHNLYHHKLRHYRRYRCTLCQKHAPFKDKDTAACHVMKDHAGTAFTCKYCGREGFKRPQYLKRHIEQHHTKPLQLKCPHCDRVFYERSWYRVHVRSHLDEVRAKTRQPATCPVCSREFKSKANMKRHLRTHEDELAGCRECGARCGSREVLRQHYWQAHKQNYLGPREEMCPHCSRICVTKAMLKRHIKRMHSDRTKRFQCDHCQRLYMTKGEVRAHITWSHLPAHARGGHACACGRVFRTPSLLREHELRAHRHTPPPRAHRCALCGKGFMDKQVLNRHMKSHSDEMYPCNECGLLFKTEPYVKIHYKIKHLNMTRAEIKAQSRRKPPTNIIQPKHASIKKKTSKSHKLNGANIEPKIPESRLGSSDVDPLFVGASDVTIKLEQNDTDIPLFQTFIDVIRDG